MKKKLLPLAVAAAMAPGFASAADVSGFADITYVLGQDNASSPAACASPSYCGNPVEGKFLANGEVDVSASPADGVTVRIDLDVNLAGNQSFPTASHNAVGDSGRIEQAFFAWGLTDGVTLLGGVFNNPIGQEAEDAPDQHFVSSSIIRSALDQQTDLSGNNVAGVAVAANAGPATITVGYLDHISGTINALAGAGTNEAREENSVAVLVNASPIEGLDLEFGIVTQAEDTNGDSTADNVGDVTNLNAQYAIPQVAGLTVGLDYATFDKIVDTAHNLWVAYDIGNGMAVKVRTEELSWENPNAGTDVDVEATSFYFSYQAASNLSIALEMRDGDGVECLSLGGCPGVSYNANAGAISGVNQDTTTTVQFIATF